MYFSSYPPTPNPPEGPYTVHNLYNRADLQGRWALNWGFIQSNVVKKALGTKPRVLDSNLDVGFCHCSN